MTFMLLYSLESSFTLLLINTGALGFFLIPIIPTGFSLSAELTHPINPALVNGLLMGCGMIYATILTFIGGSLAYEDSAAVICMFGASCIIAAIASLFIKEDLRRTNFKLEEIENS